MLPAQLGDGKVNLGPPQRRRRGLLFGVQLCPGHAFHGRSRPQPQKDRHRHQVGLRIFIIFPKKCPEIFDMSF